MGHGASRAGGNGITHVKNKKGARYRTLGESSLWFSKFLTGDGPVGALFQHRCYWMIIEISYEHCGEQCVSIILLLFCDYASLLVTSKRWPDSIIYTIKFREYSRSKMKLTQGQDWEKKATFWICLLLPRGPCHGFTTVKPSLCINETPWPS